MRASILVLCWVLGTAAPAWAEPAADASISEVESRRRAGGLLTAAGWAGVAVGTGFMLADSTSDSPFGSSEDATLQPRGPVILATSAVFLVLGLSIGLPPLLDGEDVQIVPAGPGVVILGRF